MVRMDAPAVRTEVEPAIIERTRRDWLYGALNRTSLMRFFGHLGTLRWRIIVAAI